MSEQANYPFPSSFSFYPVKLKNHTSSSLYSTTEEEVTPIIIKIIFSFPLRKEIIREFSNNKGFSLQELISLVCSTYISFYKEETDEMKLSDIEQQLTEKMNVSGRRYRRLSNPYKSKYGLWKPIEDLFLTKINLESTDQDKIPTFRLVIEDYSI